MAELCCGTGAVTDAFLKRGWTCLGFDVRRDGRYNGTFIFADVRSRIGADYRGVLDAVWASPPCTEFSWAKNPGMKFYHRPTRELLHALNVVTACFRFAHDAGAPLILENVFGLQRWLGPATSHYGKFYLWGDGAPALLPKGPRWKDRQKMLHRDALLRARIPHELAEHVAHFHDQRVSAATHPVIEHRPFGAP